jgi:hypothetical protein
VGSLCTLTVADPPGHPYGSLVAFALDAGSPVFLISTLAEHTKNLLADPRASLLIAESGEGDPLARGRVTLLGSCTQLSGDAEKRARAAFVAAHPESSEYIDFKDFRLFLLAVTSARYVGGFGRMSWILGEDWYNAQPLDGK